MYVRKNVLKVVALVLIHYHRTLEEIYLIVHKVCWEYADMILFNKQHENRNYACDKNGIRNKTLKLIHWVIN